MSFEAWEDLDDSHARDVLYASVCGFNKLLAKSSYESVTIKR